MGPAGPLFSSAQIGNSGAMTMRESRGRNADLIVRARRMYTVDRAFGRAEALAVKDGRILAVEPRGMKTIFPPPATWTLEMPAPIPDSWIPIVTF